MPSEPEPAEPEQSEPEQSEPGDQDAWIGLGEASRLLGISQGTLRRWADRGQVASFTTPGGHRRFARATVMALLPASRTRRPQLSEIGAGSERMSHAYRRLFDVAEGRPLQMLGAQLPEVDRQLFRERGRHMVECLVAHLDADTPAPAMANLHEAADHAAEYGAHSARLGASLGEAVETFLRFRAPFIAELAATARKRGLDTREATGLLVDAENAFDELLLAFMDGWQNV